MDFKDASRLIDKTTFFSSLFLLLGVTIPLLIRPEAGGVIVNQIRRFLTDVLGTWYLALGLGAFIFMVYIVFSDFGKIKLGEPDEKPEFGDFAWISMLFCAGIGASIVYWGPIEWAFYYQSPPFMIEPESVEAMRWASTYGMYHWGPVAWSIYLIPAVPIAYFYHVRKKHVLNLSRAVAPVIGTTAARGWPGKIIDVLFIFGMLGGGATSLGLAAPLINEGLFRLFEVPRGIWPQILILLVCTAIFGASAYSGLKKGIQRLSTLNVAIALGLLVYVFLVGPTTFITESSFEAVGRLASNFIQMSTWLEPFGGMNGYEDTSFPADWTIFYWAWWLAFAPTVGIFIARISKGRTIANMVGGSLVWGSLGCALFFMILGNFGSFLQLSGQLDVISILNNDSAEAAIFSILNELPFGWIVTAVFTFLALIFLATTFDSISYILASAVQTHVDDEPMRWNRLFWAAMLSLMPVSLMFLGGLNTVQTASIVGGAPLLIIAVLLCWSILIVARRDLRKHSTFEPSQINIDVPKENIDPWNKED